MNSLLPYRAALSRVGVVSHISGQNLQLCCPFCTERGETADVRYRLGITAHGLGHCFNCGWSSRKAWKVLWSKFQLEPIAGMEAETEPDKVVALPEDFQPLWKPLRSQLDRQAYQYLQARDIAPQQIRKHRIGVSWTGKLAYRIILPVYWNGKLVSIVARSLADREPRYLSMGKKHLFAMPKQSERVHLFEGVFKALRAAKVLDSPCVAVLGPTITEIELEQLAEADCKEATLWPDPDKPGRQGAIRSARLLQQIGIHVLIAQTSTPADDATPEEISRSFANRRTATWAETVALRVKV